MASLSETFLLLLAFFAAAGAQQYINPGSSLSPVSQSQPTAWQSPSGRFAFGFYSQGDGFSVGIWLVGSSENTITWTANRDDPPVSSNATLDFTIDGGKLILKADHKEKILANSSASFASMLDSGNFVLYNKDMKIIWASFDFPTETLLGEQTLSHGSKLVASVSRTNHSTGRFRLEMQEDGNLVAYPMDTTGSSVDAYWASDTWASDTVESSKHHLFLNKTGLLQLINNTNSDIIKTLNDASSDNHTLIYRATLDDDGNFRLYSHSHGDSEPTVLWRALDNLCDVKMFCGFNSYCTLNDDQPYCICLPGADFLDPYQNNRGCVRNFTKEGCKGGKENTTFYNITRMENLKWDDPPYFESFMPVQEENCSKSCLEDCDCDVAVYESGDQQCSKYKLPIRYAKRDTQDSSVVFFKVGTISINGDAYAIPEKPPSVVVVTTSKNTWALILAIPLGLITYSCVALAFSGFFIFKFRVLKYTRLMETGALGVTEDFALRSYTYKELAKVTNGFKEELGKGSFGAVYKGSLYRGKKAIAVKRLEKVVSEGEREFRAEMQVIGRTHHKNLVRLLGFCAEGSKRLLVYEYMRNGTLADLLFRAESRPDWNERVKIALDVARGILYLHEECEAPVIHCDIKPQNILMDDFWTAKISDFGLAKLLMPDQTRTFTGVRGTRGYLAPEWQKNTPISVKVDIFSYGIMLLEIVCCRRNLEVNNVKKPEEVVLSNWAYKCFVAGELDKLVGGEEVDKKTLERMVNVGLWCIQDEPALRPSIKSVLLMLEGVTTAIAVPPCPTDANM